MASKARPTAFSRILIVILLMVAIFFGVQYALTNTEWGKELHTEIQEQTPQPNSGAGRVQ